MDHEGDEDGSQQSAWNDETNLLSTMTRKCFWTTSNMENEDCVAAVHLQPHLSIVKVEDRSQTNDRLPKILRWIICTSFTWGLELVQVSVVAQITRPPCKSVHSF